MNALILRTNGKRELKKLSDDDIADTLGCSFIERLPHTKGYKHPKDWSDGSSKKNAEHYLSCWVDEEGLCAQRPTNGYAGVLMALNVTVSMGYAVFGDVVLFSRKRSGGKDMAIDPYIVDLCQKYEECEDEDEFFCALEKLNGSGFGGQDDATKSKKAGKSTKSKKDSDKEKVKKKAKAPSNNNNNNNGAENDGDKKRSISKKEDDEREGKKVKTTDSESTV
jgi:hypothetical protein